MFCKNCGTVNPQGAAFCLKCGKDLAGPSAGDEAANQLDAILAARQSDSRRPAGNLTVRLIILALASVIVLILPAILLFNQLRQTATGPIPSVEPGAPLPRGGTDPAASRINGINAPVRPGGLVPQATTKIAADAAKKAMARKIESAVEVYYAQNDRFPQTLSELVPQYLDISPEADVYRYSVLNDPYGYRLEVTMETAEVSGANIVTEGNTTKYVIQKP